MSLINCKHCPTMYKSWRENKYMLTLLVFHSKKKKELAENRNLRILEKDDNTILSTFLSNYFSIILSYLKTFVLDNLSSIRGTIWRTVKELIYLFLPSLETLWAMLQSTAVTSKDFIYQRTMTTRPRSSLKLDKGNGPNNIMISTII